MRFARSMTALLLGVLASMIPVSTRADDAQPVESDYYKILTYEPPAGVVLEVGALEMMPGDVLVRAHVLTPRVGSERLFGDELLFLLRPDHGRYRIAVLFEDFILP